MHDFHDALPGFDPGNVLHDGCGECEDRAANPLDGALALDHKNQLKLWRDMRAVKYGGLGVDRNLSTCDQYMLTALYRIAVFVERAGIGPEEIEDRMVAKHEQLEQRLLGRFTA